MERMANGAASAAELRKKSRRFILKNHTPTQGATAGSEHKIARQPGYDGRGSDCMKLSTILLAILAALTLFSCSKPTPKPKVAPSNDTAPATFRVNLDTSRGPVIVEVNRAEAPLGADRFYNLVKTKFFDGARFFRVVPGFVVQFGMAADPKLNADWDVPIQDDPVLTSNVRGTVTFAAAEDPNTRTTQLFINLGDNQRLDARRFAVFGKVVSGMDYVDRIYSGDGEKPQQSLIEKDGNAYLEKEFPNLDYIKTAHIAQ
jgi:cyclophilin family peptidyl-prolyl cis-trans isomerase